MPMVGVEQTHEIPTRENAVFYGQFYVVFRCKPFIIQNAMQGC